VSYNDSHQDATNSSQGKVNPLFNATKKLKLSKVSEKKTVKVWAKSVVANFFFSRAVLEFILALRTKLLKKQKLKITFFMKYQLIKLKSLILEADRSTSVGRTWSVDHTLATPKLGQIREHWTGKCRLTNEYPFFLFLIGRWYYEKNILYL